MNATLGATSVSARFPADPRSVRHARSLVDETLSQWRMPHLAPTATLLTSEVVTNAVLHAGTDFTVSVSLDAARQRLRVAVADNSPVLPRRRHHSSMAMTGRGLTIVYSQADAVGVEAVGTGKVVWFELLIQERTAATGEARRA